VHLSVVSSTHQLSVPPELSNLHSRGISGRSVVAHWSVWIEANLLQAEDLHVDFSTVGAGTAIGAAEMVPIAHSTNARVIARKTRICDFPRCIRYSLRRPRMTIAKLSI